MNMNKNGQSSRRSVGSLILLALLSLAALLLAACTTPATLTQPPTGTRTPAPTLTATPPPPTNTPTATPTTAPTATPPLGWCDQATAPGLEETGQVRIAYIEQGDVWLLDAGSQPVRLAEVGDAERILLSDDGELVAFTRKAADETVELWIARADGSEPRALLTSADLRQMGTRWGPDARWIEPMWLTWIPGTHRLAFQTYPAYEGIFVYTPEDLWELDLDSGALRQIMPDGLSGPVTYSPDGSTIMVGRSHFMSADGTHIRPIDFEGLDRVGMGEFFLYAPMRWDASSELVVLVSTTYDGLPPLEEYTLTVWAIPADGSAAVEIGSLLAPIWTVSISPDLRLISYLLLTTPDPYEREIHFASIDGLEDRVYFSGSNSSSIWGPDSRHFILFTDDGLVQIGDVCGPPISLPVGESRYAYAKWLSDGQFVLAITRSYEEPDVAAHYLGGIDGSVTLLGESWTAFDAVLLPGR